MLIILHKSIKNSEIVVFTKEDKGIHIMKANAPENLIKYMYLLIKVIDLNLMYF